MREYNWNDIEEAQEFDKLQAGGYICRILEVDENEEKEYIKIGYDIAKGDKAGYYSTLAEKGYNYPTFVRSYKEKALPFFKAFLSALEKSNTDFKVDNFKGDVANFIGLGIGLVLGEEEYLAGGKIKTVLKPQKILPVQEIINKNFTIPEIKKLKNNNNTNNVPEWEQLNDEELPF